VATLVQVLNGSHDDPSLTRKHERGVSQYFPKLLLPCQPHPRVHVSLFPPFLLFFAYIKLSNITTHHVASPPEQVPVSTLARYSTPEWPGGGVCAGYKCEHM
jgi:hypothetical protein